MPTIIQIIKIIGIGVLIMLAFIVLAPFLGIATLVIFISGLIKGTLNAKDEYYS